MKQIDNMGIKIKGKEIVGKNWADTHVLHVELPNGTVGGIFVTPELHYKKYYLDH